MRNIDIEPSYDLPVETEAPVLRMPGLRRVTGNVIKSVEAMVKLDQADDVEQLEQHEAQDDMYRSIYQYAQFKLTGSTDAKEPTAYTAFVALELARDVQWWRAQGKNMFREIGFRHPSEVRTFTANLRSQQLKDSHTVPDDETAKISAEEEAHFFKAIGFEKGLQKTSSTLSAETEPQTNDFMERVRTILNQGSEVIKDSGSRLRKFGRSLIERVTPEVAPQPRRRRLSMRTLGVVGVIGLLGGGMSSPASSIDVAESNPLRADNAPTHVYEMPDMPTDTLDHSETTPLVDLRDISEEETPPPVISQTETTPEAPAEAENLEVINPISETITITEGSGGYVWNQLQDMLQGSHGAEADMDVHIQALIAEAIPYIAAENGMHPDDLSNLEVGEVIKIGPQSTAILSLAFAA